MGWGDAYDGIGVRPLCYLKSEILVSVPGEDDEEKNVEVAEEDRAQLGSYRKRQNFECPE